MRKVLGLVRADLRNIVRDPLLIMGVVLPLAVALLFRFLVPAVAGWVQAYVDLAQYYPFIASFLVIMAPFMLGWVVGFLLLDERDEQILTAIAVTPLGKSGFLVYRLTIPVLASFVAAYAVVLLSGLMPLHVLSFAPIALFAALEAPLFALAIVAIAGNKVEGMAVAKGLGMVMWAPLAILFVDGPWQWAFGVVPPYWVSKATLASLDLGGSYGGAVGAGLAVHVALLAVMAIRFDRRIE